MHWESLDWLYTSYALQWLAPPDQSPIIRRPKLEQVLAYKPWAGNNIVISGPAGSGKSTLAILSALNHAETVWYLSARNVPAIPGLKITRFNGELLINDDDNGALSTSEGRSLPDTLRAGHSAALIIDDIDLVPNDHVALMHDIVNRLTANQPNLLVMFVTRHFNDSMREWVSSFGKVRTLSGDRLAITASELEELVRVKTFGDVSADSITSAWQQTGGWLAGIQRLVDPAFAGITSLDEYVLDELIMPLSSVQQSTLFALSKFPLISAEMPEYLLHRHHPESVVADNIIEQIPLVANPNTGDQQSTSIMPHALRRSLDRLTGAHSNLPCVLAFRRYGIDWFVLHDNLIAARDLAIASKLCEYYLVAIHDYCKTLALQEKWSTLRDLIRGVPEHKLLNHHDHMFWMLIAEAYDGNWTQAARLHRLTLDTWGQSNDPLVAGRAHLIQLAALWQYSKEEATYEEAVSCYATLPEDAEQERLFASVMAEVAARQIGNVEAVNHWSAIASDCRKVLSMGPEWWHMHCGFYRSSHAARRGSTALAYSQMELGLEQIDPAYPRASFRFLLLMAYIDIESGRYDAARKTLQRAEMCVNGSEPQNMLDLATAHYYLATGEPENARPLLSVEGHTIHNRPDRNSHRLRLMAQTEMVQGNLELAYDILTHWTHGEDSWPMFFGEPHHQVLKATLQVLRGETDAALELTRQLIEESSKRGHIVYAVAAYAIQAECYQRLGQPEERNTALAHISTLDPYKALVRSRSPFGRDVHSLTNSTTSTQAPPIMNQQVAREKLTQRERELLAAAAEGLNTRQIAERFFLSQSTVKNHLSSINKKLGVGSRKEALMITYPLRRK